MLFFRFSSPLFRASLPSYDWWWWWWSWCGGHFGSLPPPLGPPLFFPSQLLVPGSINF